MKLSRTATIGAVALLCGAATLGVAQIIRLDLPGMVGMADNAVHGTITAREVIRIDHPTDGPELYFTALTVQGRSLITNQPTTVDVWFGGGFINDTEGVHNSEAPSADDQKIGNEVVVFYRWEPNMGGDHAGNGLICWHGGLFRTFQTRTGKTIVQGRGEGYAIDTNIELGDLETQIQKLAKAKQK